MSLLVWQSQDSLPTQLATFAFVQLSSETAIYKIVQTVAKGFQLDFVDDLVDKGKLQEQFGFAFADAALAHIEQGCVVELAYGTAMRTFHVVGINLQHRLGEHTRLFRGTEVLVTLFADGLLGIFAHQHPSCKSTGSLLVEHILIEFVTGAMTYLMVDERVVVHMLRLVGNDTTVAEAFRSFALEDEVEFVARDAVVQGDDVMIDTTVALLFDIDIADAAVLGMRLL